MKATLRKRCLDPQCRRVFETTSPTREFCCSAHAHRAHRTWYHQGKGLAQRASKPVPPESPHQRRNRLNAEALARWRADNPELAAELARAARREQAEAFERLSKLVLPGLDDVEVTP